MKRNVFPILFFVVLSAFLKPDPINATVVLEVSFEQLVQGSELVFEGQVVSKETRPSPINGKPFTYFTFEIIDFVKGAYPNPTIEIGFMGGTHGDMTLKVSDMRMPEVGERGIYFIETLSEQLINPLFGWQQGHYLVITNKSIGQDFVVPVEQDTVKSGAKALRREVTLVDFKQSIMNIIRKDQ